MPHKPAEPVVVVSRYHFDIRHNQTKIKIGENMYSTTIIISKGTSVCPSELGHNNFYYPTPNKYITLAEDTEVEQLPWVGGGNLSAYKIIGQQNVVWIEKKYV